jgi:hypothetical protein
VAFPYLLRSGPAEAAVTLRKVGKAIQLGKNQPGGKSRVTLSPFDENSFIAGWVNVRAFGDVRPFVQKRHYNGSAQSQEIQIGGGPLTDGNATSNIAVVAFPDGSSHVYFAAQRNGAALADSFDIFLQRMSPSFRKVGNPIAINTRSAGQQDAVLAILLRNGNVQVVWFSDQTIRGRVIKPNGQPASRERTVVRTGDGTHVPKSLGQGRRGALLSYIRFGFPDAAPKGPIAVQKAVQQLNNNGGMLDQPILLDTGSAFDGAGFVGYDLGAFRMEADVAYHAKAPSSGSDSRLIQTILNLDSAAPPRDRVVGRFPIDLGTQGSPRVAPYFANNSEFFIVFFPTDANQGPTITGILVRPDNAGIVDQLVLGPFNSSFRTVDALVGLDERFVVGFSGGDDVFSDQAFLQPLFVGAGPSYP